MNKPDIVQLDTITGDYHLIAIDRLFPSATNPRKRFDDTKLKELAESIKTQGVLQPILVRKAAPKSNNPFCVKTVYSENFRPFEIVAGERRYRAAKLAGLTDMPCFVRELTDLQVLHAQVIENLQRDDLHQLEEAEGYERLMREKDASGVQYTAESIGAEVGKSKAYVYGRLKLLALCEEARQAFYDDQLDASTALLIARIPVHKLQVQAIQAITKKAEYNTSNLREGDIVMSYRAARDYIQDNFMLDLDRAPFDTKDAGLLAKASACTDCEKRTGNQPELFDDVKSKDVCTDTVCFGMKKAAHILTIQKEADARGDKAIFGKEAKKLMPDHWRDPKRQLAEHGLATLDSQVPGDEQERTWGEVLKNEKLLTPDKETGKPAVQKTIVGDPHKGGIIETVNIEDAMKALRQAGFEVIPVAAAKKKNHDAAAEKEREKQKGEIEQAAAYRQKLFDAVHQKIGSDLNNPTPHVADGLYRILALRMFEDMLGIDDAATLSKLHLPAATETDIPETDGEAEDLAGQLEAAIPTMTTQQHFLLMIDILAIHEIDARSWNYQNQPETMVAIAKEIGVDAEQIQTAATAEVKAAQKTAAKKGKAGQEAA